MVQNKFKFNKWLWLGILVQIMISPNQAIMKHAIGGMNFAYFSVLRYGLVFLISLPWLIKLIKLKPNKKGIQYSIMAGCLLALAVLAHTYALKSVDASYASILGLASPLFFIPISVKLEGDKINKKMVAGLSVSAAGAFMIVLLPIALRGDAKFELNIFATLLLLVGVIAGAFFTVLSRKANEHGIGFNSIISITSGVGLLAYSAVFFISTGGNIGGSLSLSPSQIMAVMFSAIIVIFLARRWSLMVYEKTGPIVSSALGYLETLLSVLVSIVFLGESISKEIVLGGVLIILGLYISEYHKSDSHKHVSQLKHR